MNELNAPDPDVRFLILQPLFSDNFWSHCFNVLTLNVVVTLYDVWLDYRRQNEMQRADAERLRLNRTDIVADLDVRKVLDRLIASSIIAAEDFENICNRPTSQERARLLLDILPTRGPNAFSVFLQALREAEYDWLADNLSNNQ